MFALIAAVCFALAWIFHLAGGPPEAWLQPAALLYLGLTLLALHIAGVWGWTPWRR